MSDNTQTVIVYRNRVEHDLYEHGLIFPIIMFVCITCILAVSLHKLLDLVSKKQRWTQWSTQYKWLSYAAIGLSVVLGGYSATFFL